jgi:hypothetical protein
MFISNIVFAYLKYNEEKIYINFDLSYYLYLQISQTLKSNTNKTIVTYY